MNLSSVFIKSKPNLHHLYQRCSTVEDPYRLTYFEAAILASILEDLLKELRVFMACSNEWRVVKAQADLVLLRALKYKVEQPSVTDELSGIDPRKLGCEEYKLRKLFDDRHFIHDIIEDTYAYVTMKNSYTVLAQQVEEMFKEKERCEVLMEHEAQNRVLRRDLKRQCRQVRVHIKSATYDANCTIAQLRNNVEDAALNATIRARYVDNWQRARTEQNNKHIRNKESPKENTIELYKQKFDQEQRIHAEIEMLTTIDTNESLHKVECWMDKYDKDIEAIDLKIQITKNNYVVQMEQREDLEKTIEEHDTLMKNWIKFKEDRENARLYREKMNNAAIIVQAWWRGLLVRNQLGPYKPPPKKKAAKGAKK